jgi:catechol 2,3-dioxygenase-like lactoylglutathione lyase family enzyme
MDTAQIGRGYDVGGVQLERPFRVLRLGHFGFNVADQEKALRFYSDLLGLAVTDTVNFGEQFKVTSPTGQDPNGYFLRVGADHHSVVLFPHWAFAASGQPKRDGTVWISHIAWQVGTLREVTEGRQWLTEKQVHIARPGGRDSRGANWNFTVTDPSFISNEIYYGMDQIGWDGVSKPVAICPRGDPLPAPDGTAEADFPMARRAIEGGLDLKQGLHQRPFGEAKYDVAGVMLPRPFRVVRNGPIRLFAPDVDAAARFYAETMGLTLTEEITWHGHRALFLRANTEHHTVALYPLALRAELGLRPDSLCMAYGMQVGSYRQLKDAIAYLGENGVTIKHLPPELFPGIDYSAVALDPEGHAIQLYY